MNVQVFSQTRCKLGEGAFWHPLRQQFFWFDIVNHRLLTQEDGQEQSWQFDDCVSAAGWVDKDQLLIASARALWLFELKTGMRRHLIDLEAENPHTRSNDGRADPWGGFWIGTMGFNAEPGAGAIYRYFRGELRRLVADMTITNAICFSPDQRFAYYTDTAKGVILRQRLNREAGWPEGAPEVYLDFSQEPFGPDGAVVDADGNFWNAQWGAGRVACYAPDGALLECISLPTPQASCPGFGGADLSRLFVTTAAEGIDCGAAGQTFVVETRATGQREHQVIL